MLPRYTYIQELQINTIITTNLNAPFRLHKTSLLENNDQENNLLNTNTGVNPLLSPVLGYNLYIHKIFHFFIQTRFVFGQHNHDMNKNLSEFRFSAGLGFNF